MVLGWGRMTRVNCVPVEALSRQHLIAEWKEVPRIITMVEKQIAKHGKIKPVPESYRMGKGHMQFFADKLGWIVSRLGDVCSEMKKRGYAPNMEFLGGYGVRARLLGLNNFQSWHPTEQDMAINMARLIERDPKFYGETQ